MERLRAFWNRGWLSKAIIGLVAFVLACCVVSILMPRRAPVPATVAQVTATVKPTTVEAEPTARPVPTATEIQPTAVPATNTPEPTATPTEVLASTVVPTIALVPAEPSGALGMSRAAWEAKAGAAIGKRSLGELYANGAAVVFMSDTLWFIDYWFPKNAPVDPKDAWDIGKTFLPHDAKLMKTYQRDVTTVHVYHSEWLKDRFPLTTKIKDLELSNWPEAEPGDFTLQYNVYDGKASSLIIGLGNNP